MLHLFEFLLAPSPLFRSVTLAASVLPFTFVFINPPMSYHDHQTDQCLEERYDGPENRSRSGQVDLPRFPPSAEVVFAGTWQLTPPQPQHYRHDLPGLEMSSESYQHFDARSLSQASHVIESFEIRRSREQAVPRSVSAQNYIRRAVHRAEYERLRLLHRQEHESILSSDDEGSISARLQYLSTSSVRSDSLGYLPAVSERSMSAPSSVSASTSEALQADLPPRRQAPVTSALLLPTTPFVSSYSSQSTTQYAHVAMLETNSAMDFYQYWSPYAPSRPGIAEDGAEWYSAEFHRAQEQLPHALNCVQGSSSPMEDAGIFSRAIGSNQAVYDQDYGQDEEDGQNEEDGQDQEDEGDST